MKSRPWSAAPLISLMPVFIGRGTGHPPCARRPSTRAAHLWFGCFHFFFGVDRRSGRVPRRFGNLCSRRIWHGLSGTVLSDSGINGSKPHQNCSSNYSFRSSAHLPYFCNNWWRDTSRISIKVLIFHPLQFKFVPSWLIASITNFWWRDTSRISSEVLVFHTLQLKLVPSASITYWRRLLNIVLYPHKKLLKSFTFSPNYQHVNSVCVEYFLWWTFVITAYVFISRRK